MHVKSTAIKRKLNWLVVLIICSVSSISAAESEEKITKLAWQDHFVELEQVFTQAFIDNDASALSHFRTKNPAMWGIGKLHYNVDANQAIFVQVPHRYFDKASLAIAQHWLHSDKVKLLMSNSHHRFLGRDSEPAFNSDFSSAPYSPMMAASRSFMGAFSQGRIFQLHGFTRGKRHSNKGRRADVILSHGSTLPSFYLTDLHRAARCIEQTLSAKTFVFPSQVNELGGTQNVIAKHLQRKGYFQNFYHIELSAELRKKLKNNRVLSLKLFDCLAGAL
jgi:hypothetical protein